MKDRSRFSLVLNTVFLSLALTGGAQAAQVQTALAANKIGISVKDLMPNIFATNITLPSGTAKPSGMGNVVAGVHLGTNTDIFAVGTRSGLGNFTVNASEFWVRYTLDSTSNFSSTSSNVYPVSEEDSTTTTRSIGGSLWLSFNLANGSFGFHTQQLSSPKPFYLYNANSYATFSPVTGQSAVSVLHEDWNGNYEWPVWNGNASLSNVAEICLECSFAANLNLSFLELRWDGSRYGLFTSGW